MGNMEDSKGNEAIRIGQVDKKELRRMKLLDKRRHEKKFAQDMRLLSGPCVNDMILNTYLYRNEFSPIRDRYIGKRFLNKALKKWAIHSPMELKNKIEWLLTEGVRDEFDQLRHELRPLTRQGKKQFLKHLPEDSINYARYHLVERGFYSLPKSGIMAFDLTWAIYLSRVGKRLGYITKIEARQYMMRALQLAQDNYVDKAAYMYAYNLGAYFYESDTAYNQFAKYGLDFISQSFGFKDHEGEWDRSLLEGV